MRRGPTVFLRTIRLRRGLTQAELATLSGVRQHTISKLESRPGPRTGWIIVKKLSMALGLDPSQLLFGPDPKARIRADGKPLDARSAL